jgi:hypothetical protein
LYLIFLIQALLTRRHLPLWAIITFFVLSKALYFLWSDARKFKGGTKRFAKVYTFIWVISIIVVIIQVGLSFRDSYYFGLNGYFYPQAATAYLKNNLPDGNVFSLYGWGGYLIWKIPEKKVFIDGRMPSWRWDAPENELSSSFDTYNDVLQGNIAYKEIFNKFNIDTVLWSKQEAKSEFENFMGKIENYLTVVGYKKNDFDFIGKLNEDGWKTVYENSSSIIYGLNK